MRKPLLSSYSCRPRPEIVRTDFDTGLPRVRRRSQAKIYDIEAEYLMSTTELDQFTANYWGSAQGGAGFINIPVKIDGHTKTVACRLVEPYTVRQVTSDTHKVAMKLEYIE